VQKNGGRLRRITWLSSVVVPLKAGSSSYSGLILRPAFTKLCGRARKIRPETTRFDEVAALIISLLEEQWHLTVWTGNPLSSKQPEGISPAISISLVNRFSLCLF
jgi:hypothetical protein